MPVVMWFLVCVCLIPSVRTFQNSNFQPNFKDVLNYHRSVQLFIKDWLDNSYGKVNFTDKQKAYYHSLTPGGAPPEIKILSFSGGNNEDILLHELGAMFASFNRELHDHRGGTRHRREAGEEEGLIAQIKNMPPGRDKEKRISMLQFKLNRLLKAPPRNKLSEEKREEKIKKLKTLIAILKKRQQKEGPPATVGAQPPVTPTKIVAAHPPQDNNGLPPSPPTPPFPPEQVPFENIPTPDPDKRDFFLENIFGGRKKRSVVTGDLGKNYHRKKRSFVTDVAGKNYQAFTHLENNMFRSALKQLSKRIDNLSQYHIFVKTHRLVESPLAYSQENSYLWNRQFLERFESALQHYQPTVKIPYLDLCGILQNRGFESMPMWSDMLDTEVISECAWIGHTLKRHVVPSMEIITRLNATLGCSSRSLHHNIGIEQFADVHSLFGPCEAGGSHLACPSCAVSDPFFWMIYADLQRRIY